MLWYHSIRLEVCRMKKIIYKLYKKMEDQRLAATAFHYLYGVVLPAVSGKYRPAKYDPRQISYKREDETEKPLSELKLAVISDEMTYVNLEGFCRVSFLTPDNWFRVMEEEQPDVFFCEAAWSGNEAHKDAWRGKIYKNGRLLFENRKVLFQILDYCRRSGIKTVFWNKEDPVYFGDMCHDFADTALHFDYIFTTAAECVEKYEARGHRQVSVMHFGFSPQLFDCPAEQEKEDHAIFAGSWYGDHPNRCRDMEAIFDLLLKMGIPLKIYDRHFGSENPVHRFPEKYHMYIHPAVSYEVLPELYRKARFAVNINTETDSETMYARRVHELMACRCIVISNESKGMRKNFGKNVWFAGEPFELEREAEIRSQNYELVMKQYTNHSCFMKMLKEIGFNINENE